MSAGAPPVPRPPSARAGGPAPWAGLGPLPRLTTADVRGALASECAGDASQAAGPPVADSLTRSAFVDVSARDSAVVVPLFDAADGVRVVLTRRAAALTHHSGQVAFPGGRAESGETLEGAALREAWEEVGLDAADVDIIGSLTAVPTVVSNLVVHPFVGIVPPHPRLVPHPGEVDHIFDVSLAELIVDGVYREELWPTPVGERSVFFFDVSGETVWGVTAAILTELLTIITVPRARRLPRDLGSDMHA